MMKSTFVVAAAGLAVSLSGMAHAQLVVGNSATSNRSIVLVDISGTQSNRVLVSDSVEAGVAALAADDAGRRLFWANGTTLRTAPYTFTGELPVTTLGTVTIAGTSTSLTPVGLAWDSAAGKLYATRTAAAPNGGIYEINLVTMEATQIWVAPSGVRLDGFDYDPQTDAFYMTNLNTAFPGRGVFRLSKPVDLVDPLEFVADLPDSNTNYYGAAVGNGRMYLIRPTVPSTVHILDLSTGQYVGTLDSPLGNTSTGNSGGAWAPGLLVAPPGVDLSVTGTGPGLCGVQPGQIAQFSFTIQNQGADASQPVMLTIPVPAGVTFTGSTPTGTESGGVVTISLSSVPGSGGTLMADVGFVSNTPGTTLDVTATVSSADTDINPGNNSTTLAASYTPGVAGPTEIVAVLSTFAGTPSGMVPGMSGASFSPTNASPFGYPRFSPNGRNWSITGFLNEPAATDSFVLVSVDGAASIVAQEGVTPLPTGAGVTATTFTTSAVNDAGRYAFTGNDTNLSTFNRFIVKSDGTGLVKVTQQADPVPASTGIFGGWGATTAALNMAADGTVAFYSNLLNQATGQTNALFRADGTELIAQSGVTVPTGDGRAYSTFSTGEGQNFRTDANGQNWITRATLTGSGNTIIVAVNNQIVIQQGFVLNGSFSSAVSAVTGVDMTPGGTWFAYGSNADGADWVVRGAGNTFEVIALKGEEIFPGAGIRWDDAAFAAGFFIATGNDNGDYVVAGLTDHPNTINDAIVVLNGERIIARENDRIDFGAGGGDHYINIFRNDRVALTDTDFYFVVSTRDQQAALCGGPITVTGHAFVRVPIGDDVPTCPGDFNNDGDVTTADITAFLSAWFADRAAGAPPFTADFNNDGAVTTADITAFLSAWFDARAGGC